MRTNPRVSASHIEKPTGILETFDSRDIDGRSATSHAAVVHEPEVMQTTRCLTFDDQQLNLSSARPCLSIYACSGLSPLVGAVQRLSNWFHQ